MSTNISNAAAYCAASDAILLWDVRLMGDLFHDDGSRATSAQITTALTAENNLFNKHAQIAAGWIEAAVLRGDRYQVSDLASTLGGNSQQLLVWLNCSLAMKSLLRRRSGKRPWDELKADIEEATAILTDLASGILVFSLQENCDAGVAEHTTDQPSDVEARDLVTYQMHRFFARRANRRSTARHS